VISSSFFRTFFSKHPPLPYDSDLSPTNPFLVPRPPTCPKGLLVLLIASSEVAAQRFFFPPLTFFPLPSLLDPPPLFFTAFVFRSPPLDTLRFFPFFKYVALLRGLSGLLRSFRKRPLPSPFEVLSLPPFFPPFPSVCFGDRGCSCTVLRRFVSYASLPRALWFLEFNGVFLPILFFSPFELFYLLVQFSFGTPPRT